MEQPFKRRRVSRRDVQPIEPATTTDNHGQEWASFKLVKENGAETQLPLYKGTPIIAPSNLNPPLNKPIPSRKASRRGGNRLSKIRQRDYDANSPETSTAGSVVQVVVDTGGATIAKALVPAASSIVSFEGIGQLTVNHNPILPSLLPSSQFNALVQQPTASETSQPASATSAAATNNPSVAQSSTAVDSPGPSSQNVLSPQPSTPLPSSPSSSADSTGLPLFAAASSAKFHAVNVSSPPTTVELIIPFPSASNSTSTTLTTTLVGTTESKSTQAPTMTTTSSSSHTGSSTVSVSSSNRSRKSFIHSTRRTSTSTSLATSTSSQHSSSATSSATSSSLVSSAGAPIGGGGGGSGGGATSTGLASPSSTAVSGAGSSNGNTPSTQAVAGGVVGGVAGIALILVLFIFFLRRRRRNRLDQGRGIPSTLPQTTPRDSVAPGDTTTERSSAAPLAAGGFFRRLRPHSGQTAATSDTGPSERGFQNFGGRKLESVLSSRGDGYGDPGPSSGAGSATGPGVGPSAFRGPTLGHSPGPSRQETLSGSSFYRDSQGFYGGKEAEPGSLHSSLYVGPGSTQAMSPTFSAQSPPGLPPEEVGHPGQRDSGVAVMRPSPARMPVTNQPGYTPLRNPPPPPRSVPPSESIAAVDPPHPLQQDQLGRSHPSFDGSRGSRFTEEV